MSRARSVADLGNQNVLDLNASEGTLKVGAGVTIENTGEVQFAGIVTAATVQVGAATTLHSTGLDLGSGTLTCHNITSTGLLTYEDVTSVDSIGIITARSGIDVGTGTSISSPSSNVLTLGTAGSERLRIDSSSTISIGNLVSPASANIHLDLYCNSSYDAFIRFRDESGAPGLIGFDHGSNAMQFYTNGASPAMSIDSSDRMLLGLTSARATKAAASIPSFQIEGTVDSDSRMNIGRNSNSDNGPEIHLYKSRGTTLGSNTIVQDDDQLGSLLFIGADGSDLYSRGAEISAFVDGTPGNDDMPSRLVFSTSASGSAAATERLRIDANGVVRINETAEISGSATPKLFVRTASSTDTTDIVAKFGNNNTQTSSEAVIAMSAGYSLTASDTEGHVQFGAQRAGNGNKSGFIVKTWDGTNFNRHFRVDSAGGTNLMRSQNGGTHDNSTALDNWWRIGEFRNVTMGWRGHITLMGAQSYSAGAVTAGHSIINLCIVNNNTVTGHFYGVSGQTGTVKSVATAYDAATDILQVWVQPATSYAGFGVLPNASFGGWYADATNTGSSSVPSGATTLSSHLHFQIEGSHALSIESDRNIRLSRAGLTIYVRNSATSALIGSANLPVTLVACTTDGGTNTATVYWAQNYGANNNPGCLGAVTGTDNIVSPGTSVSSGCTIYGFVGRL